MKRMQFEHLVHEIAQEYVVNPRFSTINIDKLQHAIEECIRHELDCFITRKDIELELHIRGE